MLKFIIKLLWDLPSNLVAILLLPFLGVDKFEFNKDKGVIITTMSYNGGLTLGCFIFVGTKDKDEILRHEYGHIRQGWICGPLYLLIIGIPSIIWCCVYKSLMKPLKP